MKTLVKRYALAVLGSVALWGLATPTVHAQANWYDPFGTARQAAFNIGLWGRAMSRVPPYALGYNPYPSYYAPPYYPPYPYLATTPAAPYYGGTLATNPYATSPGYSGSGASLSTTPYSGGGYPSYDPSSGALQGSASVIASEGHFRVMNQQAMKLREEARQMALETRKKAFDEWLYERANTPTPQDERERFDRIALNYYLKNPAPPEIYSGSALNAILDQVQQLQAKGQRGPNTALEEDSLKQINVSPTSGSNMALLKNDGRLSWTPVLNGPDYEPERKNLERNVPLAMSEAEKHGQADRGRVKDMVADLDKMSDRLSKAIGEILPSPYIEARRYLNLLGDALKALQTPDAANLLNGKYSARGKTVGELVKNMSGLRFMHGRSGRRKGLP